MSFEYVVNIDHTSRGKLGLECDRKLLIKGIREGLFQGYNDSNPLAPVKIFDRIVEVNGIRDNIDDMLTEMGEPKMLQITLVRGSDGILAKAKTFGGSILKHPDFRGLTICTAGGAVTLGAVGGAFGTACGIVVGSAAGLIPALFTLGLSIPAGAVVGGAGGSCLGSTSGACLGGAAGFGGYRYRVEIKDGVIFVKRRAQDATTDARDATVRTFTRATQALSQYKTTGQEKISVVFHNAVRLSGDACRNAKPFTKAQCDKAIALAKDRKAQVTTVSAAAGGVAGGVAGGTAGLVAGAAVGVVPAIFTFGLSIPVCATVGLATGALGGGAVGTVGGGTAGYLGYSHKKELSDGMQAAAARTSASVDYLKSKAATSADQVRQSVRALVAGSTGGTA
eukprot:TRINITY_DN5521_c0_g1_i1.p1 TRINITY_DN5521_c0_g1~~TRINITY_DN5521_c0_g1_i1.p1  ORF type:complete len:394 (+),score=91.59 TRINITY_DN5521_c0_g1_i1:61-1242(+)